MNSEPVLIVPVRSLGGFVADAVIEEVATDDLEVTEHPVEEGSVSADHAFKRPSEVSLTYVWDPAGKNNPGKDPTFLRTTYQNLLQLQVARVPFQVFTGKRVFNNMLMTSIRQTTDEKTENVLMVHISLREVLMARTQLVQISDASVQLLPNKTAPVTNLGPVNLQPSSKPIGVPK